MLDKLIVLASIVSLSLSQNVCSPNPCYNGATCVQTGATVGYCQCPTGYTGSLCQSYTMNCSSPCLNSGVCVLVNGLYTCSCPSGYYGSQCQYMTTNTCTGITCLNGGTCTINYSVYPYYYQCSCPSGYTGTNCQTATNACSSNPCYNLGTCVASGSSYYCNCPSGYTGSQCQSISSNPCSVSPCMNGGICSINYSVYPTYYQCTCVNGYSGTTCQTAPSSSTCVDTNTVTCPLYASSNFCSNVYSINGVTIPNYCPKSCNTCSSSTVVTTTISSSTCVDTYSSCSTWVANNWCSLYPVYNMCRRSCNLC